MASKTDSALLSLVDGDDELTGGMATDENEVTFIDMNSDTDHLLGEETSNKKSESIFSFSYYQQLFDVDTDDILARLAWSFAPRPNFTSNFAKEKIKNKPDLYGPFWICVTLIFSVAIAGNIASYFQYRFEAQNLENQHWHYNFHKVTLSATIVFLYATLVPSGLFGALWSSTPKDSPQKPSFIELVCIFGYSLAAFVPASVLWLIQISTVQWLVVLLSFILSGGVLALAIWPTVNEFSGNKSKSYTLIAIVLAIHLLLACGFMLCFFHVPSNGVQNPDITKVKTNVTITANHVEETKGNQNGSSHEEKRDAAISEEKPKSLNILDQNVRSTANQTVGNEDLKSTVKPSVKKALDENSKVTQ